MAEIRAVANRGRDTVQVVNSAGKDTPRFHGMIQAFVDKRRVKDGMAVLVATVPEDGGN